MATWLDALLQPAKPGKIKKRRITENGRCRSCGAEVFWDGARYISIENGAVSHHRCHRALLEDFDDLSDPSHGEQNGNQ